MSKNTDAVTLLEKNFDIAFAAPDGIKKLRELILSLAMQGKLVPQDANDQPASELLKEIMAEKSRLVKDGKIKASKPLPEIKSDEVPYDLPKGWKWVRLGDLAIFINGDRGKNYPSKDVYVLEGIPFINAGHLVNGLVDWDEMNYILEERFEILGSGKVKNNDILYCLRGSLGKTAVVKSLNRGAIASSLVIIRLYQLKLVQFTYHYLTSPWGKEIILKYDNGSAQPNLSASSIQKYYFPLPPLAEQCRIVAKIDELMARCDELEKLKAECNQKQITVHKSALNRLLTAKNHSDFKTSWHFITHHFGELYSVKENVAGLRKAILQLAVMGKLVPQDNNDQPASELLNAIKILRESKFSKTFPSKSKSDQSLRSNLRLPASWELCQVWQIATVCLGGTPSRQDLSFWNGNIPWVSSGEVANCRIQSTEEYITDEGLQNSNAKIYPCNTVLIAMIGQGKTRGQSAILDIEASTNQNVAGLVFDCGNIEPNYVWKWALGEYEKTRSGGRGGAQPALNGSKIRDLWIPIPPLSEQHRIVDKIDQLMTLCDELEKQIDAAESKQTNLLNSMMTKV